MLSVTCPRLVSCCPRYLDSNRPLRPRHKSEPSHELGTRPICFQVTSLVFQHFPFYLAKYSLFFFFLPKLFKRNTKQSITHCCWLQEESQITVMARRSANPLVVNFIYSPRCDIDICNAYVFSQPDHLFAKWSASVWVYKRFYVFYNNISPF